MSFSDLSLSPLSTLSPLSLSLLSLELCPTPPTLELLVKTCFICFSLFRHSLLFSSLRASLFFHSVSPHAPRSGSASRRPPQVGAHEQRPVSSPSGYGATVAPRHQMGASTGRPVSDITTGRSVLPPPGLTASPAPLIAKRSEPSSPIPRRPAFSPARAYNEQEKAQALRIQSRVRSWFARKEARTLRNRTPNECGVIVLGVLLLCGSLCVCVCVFFFVARCTLLMF
jgi:hypothetical protein